MRFVSGTDCDDESDQLTVLRFPPAILAIVPEEQPDQHQRKEYRENDLRRDEGIQCAGHTELFVAGRHQETINFDRAVERESRRIR
jgi:hypothetical protein